MNLPSSVLRRLVVVRSAFAASLLLVILASNLSAASYYVDYAGGVDSNGGTSTSGAWKHCPGDPAGTSTAAATNLAAGDTVFFKGGVSYVFTGGTGIVLRWNGSTGQPITYDGNSNAAWGVGSAKFTDNFGPAAISAFSSAGNASYLAFKSLDLGAIGGAASLPADQGTAVAARFGGGIVFNGSVVGTVIDSCSFHDLGYAFAQHPMSSESINGTGIAFRDCSDLAVTNSTFARTGVGIQMAGSTALSALKITNCTFLDAMVWTINQPADATLANVSISGCADSTSNVFDRLVWNGYGPSPRVTTKLVVEGTSATLTASDIASPAASFQWMKNGAPISGATTSHLDFANAALSDAGVYTVTATNSSGTTLSNDAVLTVSAATSTPTNPTSPSNPTSPTNPVANAPVITTQPASTTVAPFATAVFSVVATGSPAPTYQWQRSGIAIPGWTSATLSLEGISSNDVGAYNVVVTNSAGSVTSNTATLSVGTATQVPVAVAPTITTQPVGQTVTVAVNVTFTVATTGTPTPSLQWLKDGAPLSGRTDATLTLAQVALAEAGAYTVSVSNSGGTVTSYAATLVVLSPTAAPSFTTQPVSQTVASLSSVTFTAAATGTPTPTYQWTRNGITIPGWTSASLTLDGISTNDIGSYAVTAINPAGSTTSNSAVLSVNSTPSVPSTPTTSGAPIITAQPTNQIAAAFSTVHFSVTADRKSVV